MNSPMTPAEEMVQRLSREEIEDWRAHFMRDYASERLNDEGDALNYAEINALCDLALSAESLSRRVAELEAQLLSARNAVAWFIRTDDPEAINSAIASRATRKK